MIEGVEVRKNFHHELDIVRDDIVRMSGLVSEALARATRAFLRLLVCVARQDAESDRSIELRGGIRETARRLAGDIVEVWRVATDHRAQR